MTARKAVYMRRTGRYFSRFRFVLPKALKRLEPAACLRVSRARGQSSIIINPGNRPRPRPRPEKKEKGLCWCESHFIHLNCIDILMELRLGHTPLSPICYYHFCHLLLSILDCRQSGPGKHIPPAFRLFSPFSSLIFAIPSVLLEQPLKRASSAAPAATPTEATIRYPWHWNQTKHRSRHCQFVPTVRKGAAHEYPYALCLEIVSANTRRGNRSLPQNKLSRYRLTVGI